MTLKNTLLAVLALGAGAAQADNVVDVNVGLGGRYAPAYFGSDTMVAGPTGSLSFNELRFGDRSLVGKDAPEGFGLRGGFRFIGARTASASPELAGLPDVDAALELGMGVGYEAPMWRAFADLRQGVGGHNGQVVELGADLKVQATPKLGFEIGPRALYGSDAFVDTYFNVSAASALTSSFAAYNGGAGLVSTGIRATARYDISDAWKLNFGVQYDVLQGDAANSPIVQTDSQTSVSITLSRALRLTF